jgi:hypothetical protein
MSWFYRAPERIPYLISERVNSTFWDARFGGLMLRVDRAEPPFKMVGTYTGAEVQLEWEPAKWLRLATCPAAPALAAGVGNVLYRQPTLRYQTPDGYSVWEWWVEGADHRWQELQGKPAFLNPVRLQTDE